MSEILGILFLVVIAFSLAVSAVDFLLTKLQLLRDRMTGRRLYRRLLSLEPSWPSGAWELPAAESHLLLYGLNRPSTEPFKLVLMESIAQGTFGLEGDRIVPGPAFEPPEAEPAAADVTLPGRSLLDSDESTRPGDGHHRRIGYRDVPLLDDLDRNQIVALLQRGESVEVLQHERGTGLAMVRSGTGETGWVKEIELQQQSLRSGVAGQPVQSPTATRSPTAPSPLRYPELDWEERESSLRILYRLWRDASRSPKLADPALLTLKFLAKEVAGDHGSVSKFGTQRLPPVLVRRGLCVHHDHRYSLTPAGEEAKSRLEYRIAAYLRADVRAQPVELRTVRAVLMQAILAVSLGHRVSMSSDKELDALDAEASGTAPATDSPPRYMDSYALWSLHWHDIDTAVDSAAAGAGGDGGDGDGGDFGDAGGFDLD